MRSLIISTIVNTIYHGEGIVNISFALETFNFHMTNLAYSLCAFSYDKLLTTSYRGDMTDNGGSKNTTYMKNGNKRSVSIGEYYSAVLVEGGSANTRGYVTVLVEGGVLTQGGVCRRAR